MKRRRASLTGVVKEQRFSGGVRRLAIEANGQEIVALHQEAERFSPGQGVYIAWDPARAALVPDEVSP